jgi:hypothetical protein
MTSLTVCTLRDVLSVVRVVVVGSGGGAHCVGCVMLNWYLDEPFIYTEFCRLCLVLFK